MAYGKIDVERKRLSQVVAAKDDLHGRVGAEFQTGAILLKGSDDVIEPMGVLVGLSTGGNWGVITGATDVSSGFTAFAVVVGDKNGVGYNQEDVTVPSAGVLVTALLKGDAVVLKSGLEFGSTTTHVNAIIAKLEAAGIKVAEAAVSPVISLT